MKIFFIKIIILLWVLLDIFNNYIQYFNIDFISIANIKGFLLIPLFLCLRKSFSYLIIVLFISIALIRILLFYLDYNYFNISELFVSMRFLSLIIWICIFSEFKSSIVIKYALDVFIFIIIISVFCGLIGFVLNISFFESYPNERFGYKGIYFSTNDTSILYLVSLFYSLTILKNHRYILLFFTLLGMLLLIAGSKTILFGSILVPLLYFNRNIFSKRNYYKLLLISLIFLFIVQFIYSYIFINIIDITYVNQLEIMNDKYGYLTSLLSGRDLKIYDALNSYYSIWQYLFGTLINIESVFIPDYMVENDFMDLIVNFGFLGFIIFLYFIRYNISNSQFSNNNLLKSFIMLLVILGLFVGHTLISATNSIWIALFFIYYCFCLNKNYSNEKI